MGDTSAGESEYRDLDKDPIISNIVEVEENKNPDLTQKPFREFDKLIKGETYYLTKVEPQSSVHFKEGEVPANLADYIVKSSAINVDFESVTAFEAQYVTYDRAPYKQIIKEMGEKGWETPSLEQSILFAMKDKTFSSLDCLDKKREREFCIDARGVLFYNHDDYNIRTPPGPKMTFDELIEVETASDREILFVRVKKLETKG